MSSNNFTRHPIIAASGLVDRYTRYVLGFRGEIFVGLPMTE
jgi:hypothetical protein